MVEVVPHEGGETLKGSPGLHKLAEAGLQGCVGVAYRVLAGLGVRNSTRQCWSSCVEGEKKKCVHQKMFHQIPAPLVHTSKISQ